MRSPERGSVDLTELTFDPGEVTEPPPRMIAVWCPDWPVTTARLDAGLDADAPIAVLTGNYVVACSHRARTAGVRRGLRRREAQARCPELAVLARNEAAEARAFEPVVAGLESIAPGRRDHPSRAGGDQREGPDPLLRRRDRRAARAVARGDGPAATRRRRRAHRHRRRRVRRRAVRAARRRSSTRAAPRRSSPACRSRRSTRPAPRRWSTCCAGSVCSPSARSPRCPRATCWPDSARTARGRTGRPAAPTTGRSRPAVHRSSSP